MTYGSDLLNHQLSETKAVETVSKFKALTVRTENGRAFFRSSLYLMIKCMVRGPVC